jgi:hypothetical protein
MQITRKILYNLFKDIAEKHLQIHSFFWGDVPDAFGRQDIIFPLMIVTPNSVSMNLGEVSHSYTVTILDRLIDGDVNKVDVDSDCFQYYRDVVAQLDRLNQVDFGIEFPMTPEPVQDVSPHLCYGFQGEMLINVDENYDQCAVPSEPISFDPTLVCLPASYVVKYTNDVIIEQGTIPSGGSVVVIVPDAPTCLDATWELRDTDGVLIDSGTIPSGGSATIVAPDGVVDVRDTDGNTLYSVSVVSGGSAIQVVGDSSVEVRNSLNVVVDSGVVKAEGSGVFNAPDATFTINGDASFSPIPSAGAENVLVENTNGTPVGAFDGNSNSWVIPDQTIEVNTVNEGSIPSVGTIEIDITDGTNPVTPNDVTIVGRKVTVEVPSGGGSPSGVQFQFPIPIQRTSYRTGDEGWRVQNGWYDYTPPAMPKVVAELDYTSTNWADTLSSPLIVNGVSSTDRFVDAFGAKIAGSASVVIDKLQGVAFTRTVINKANWNAAIDDALTYSITVNSITFSDWYLIGLNDILPTTRMEAGVAFTQLIDLSASLLFFSTNVYTATTNPANTSQMWHVVFSGRNYTAIDKTFGISAIYVHDAKNLITAP